MNFKEDRENKTARFTLVANSDLIQKGDVDRISFQETTYTFQELGDGKVEITIHSKLTLAFQVPEWMITSSMPSACGETLEKLVQLAGK